MNDVIIQQERHIKSANAVMAAVAAAGYVVVNDHTRRPITLAGVGLVECYHHGIDAEVVRCVAILPHGPFCVAAVEVAKDGVPHIRKGAVAAMVRATKINEAAVEEAGITDTRWNPEFKNED